MIFMMLLKSVPPRKKSMMSSDASLPGSEEGAMKREIGGIRKRTRPKKIS